MGLEAFDIAEDNKGGRKPKEEDEEEDYGGRKLHGNAYYEGEGIEPEEYWEDIYQRHVSDDKPTKDEIQSIAHESILLPRTVKEKLTEFELYEYEEFVESNVEDSPTNLDVDNEAESGLKGLVSNAK